jgi:hypothetical protein
VISSRFVLVSGVLAVACGGERGGERVTLRFQPAAGAAQQYAIEQHTTMNFEGGPMAQLGEQRMTVRMYVTQTVTGPAEGGTAVTLTFDSTQLESPALPVGQMDDALRRMRGLTGQLIVDERMRVVGVAFQSVAGLPPNVGDQLGSTVRGLVFPFPEQPVRVGESWTEAIDLPLGELPGNPGPVRATTTLTLREVRVQEGDTSVVLDVVSAMPQDPIRVQAEGGQATIRLNGALEGEQEFSLTRGLPLTAAIAGVVRMTMTGPSGEEMTLMLDQHVTMRPVGGP